MSSSSFSIFFFLSLDFVCINLCFISHQSVLSWLPLFVFVCLFASLTIVACQFANVWPLLAYVCVHIIIFSLATTWYTWWQVLWILYYSRTRWALIYCCNRKGLFFFGHLLCHNVSPLPHLDNSFSVYFAICAIIWGLPCSENNFPLHLLEET